jgi:membrane fusion protein (multidrug efflux system)
MKKIPAWLSILAVIVILIVSKFIFFPNQEEEKSGMKEKMKGPSMVNYEVVTATQLDYDIYTTGTIGAFNQVELYSEVNGKIIGINFTEGQLVEKGSLLIQINDADIQAQLLKSQNLMALAQQKLERLKKIIEINGVSKEELEIQENELNTLKADHNYLQAQLEKTKIKAPFTGVIGLKNISIGAFVNSSIPLTSLVQLKPVFVEFSFPEKYSEFFKIGTEVKFESEQQQQTSAAKVYAIEPRVDPLTKTIKARALYEGEKKYYPGSFSKVFLKLNNQEESILIPTESIIPTMKGQKVFIVKNGKAYESAVKIGVRKENKIQILEGLNEGDTLITSGLMSVKNESEIQLIKSGK